MIARIAHAHMRNLPVATLDAVAPARPSCSRGMPTMKVSAVAA